MSEAINHIRAVKNFGPSWEMTPEQSDAKLLRRAKALLRLNGYESGNSYQHRVWGIYNEYGLLALTTGRHESDALDNAVDCDCMDSCLIEDHDYSNEDSEAAYLGNASEPFDLTYIGIVEIA